MAAAHPMIAQSLEFFAQGIVLLIGILVFLFFAGILFLALYISLRVWLFHLRQRRAYREYLRRTRRADGKTYPPQGPGICEKCGRVRKIVYYLRSGEKLCHDCYETWWPTAESREAEPAPPALKPDRAAEGPQPQPAQSHERTPRPALHR